MQNVIIAHINQTLTGLHIPVQEEFSNGLLIDEQRNSRVLVYKRKFRGGVPMETGGHARLYMDVVSDPFLLLYHLEENLFWAQK